MLLDCYYYSFKIQRVGDCFIKNKNGQLLTK